MDFLRDIINHPGFQGKWGVLAIGAVFFMFMIARRRKMTAELRRKDREPRYKDIIVEWDESKGPEGQLTIQPWMETDGVKAVFAAITADGKQARFVGGCVRDAFLKRPVTDVDIATQETPDRVVTLLERAGLKAVPTGIEHGTVTAIVGDETYEITTLRQDVSTDGRRAVVKFTEDWRQDAERRDFTFNTLSADLDGSVHDYFNGLQDLNNRVIRFVGLARERIAEDRLRVLRFFRFIGTLGMRIDSKGDLESCIQAAPELTKLSGERIRDEMLKILASEMHFDVVRLMQNYHVLEHILPEAGEPTVLARLKWLETRAINFDSVFPDPIRRLAAVLDTDAAGVEAVGERLRLSNAQKDRLRAIHDPGWIAEPDVSAADYDRVLHNIGPETALDLILITWAKRLLEVPKLPKGEADNWQVLIAKAEEWDGKVFPLRGRDVLALGIDPGPAVSEYLSKVETWWEAGGFTADRDACLTRLEEEVSG